MAYSASLGVTTNVDMGAFVIPGTPDTQASAQLDTLASDNPFTMHEPILALHREGKVSTRLRIFYLSMDKEPNVPLIAQRVLNAYPGFGDDMVRISGIGEFVTALALVPGRLPGQLPGRAEAGRGKRLAVSAAHADLARRQFHHREFSARWPKHFPSPICAGPIAHVPEITAENIAAAKALGSASRSTASATCRDRSAAAALSQHRR